MYAAAGVDPGYPVDGQSLLESSTRERILIEHFHGGRDAGVVPDWAGWWRPDSMFRQSLYGSHRSKTGHSPTVTRVFSVIFKVAGELALPAWAEWGGGAHEAWASTQITARR